jgi:lycopene cyclase domain-containing protein
VSALYLLVDLAVIAVPLAFSWHPRLRFADRWRDFIPACVIVGALFLAWDVSFTALGVWGFNDAYLLGPRIAGLPLEEWLFFFCIPYACVFTYHCLGVIGAGGVGLRNARALTGILLVLCLALVVVLREQLYTSITAGLLVVFLVWVLWSRSEWIGRLWFSFLMLIAPFLITNGVLTGLGFWKYPLLNTSPEAITDQIVWYNNAHNLGVRLFSVPLDDFLYAFLLIGLNVALFEGFAARRAGGQGRLGSLATQLEPKRVDR